MVNTIKSSVEFDGLRSDLYEQAIFEYPSARNEDILAMHRLLDPQSGNKILGVGEGNGYFCKPILESIGKTGVYTVTDPSRDQLSNLQRRAKSKNLEIQISGAESIEVPDNSYDKVWAFGSLHHCLNKTEAFKRIYSSLKDGGKAVICDVFQGSDLAKHFDDIVAKYCETGHEVNFFSEEFAKSLTWLSGFNNEDVEIVNLPQKWAFDSKNDLGKFIYKLHALTGLAGSEEERIGETIEGCERVLGIDYDLDSKKYLLNWPMKALVAEK